MESYFKIETVLCVCKYYVIVRNCRQSQEFISFLHEEKLIVEYLKMNDKKLLTYLFNNLFSSVFIDIHDLHTMSYFKINLLRIITYTYISLRSTFYENFDGINKTYYVVSYVNYRTNI